MTNATPNLTTESGREENPVQDRIGLLRHDLLIPPLNGITSDTPAASQAIHDLKLTVGWIRNTIELYDRAIASGTTNDQLQKGANRMLSNIECLILALRRGGHREWDRVRKLQLTESPR